MTRHPDPSSVFWALWLILVAALAISHCARGHEEQTIFETPTILDTIDLDTACPQCVEPEPPRVP